MERKIGRNNCYLVFMYKGNVAGAIKFVDDYRPAFNRDERYAEVNTCSGCIWYNDTVKFNSKDEGNEFYTQKKSEGWTAGTEKQFDDFVRLMGI